MLRGSQDRRLGARFASFSPRTERISGPQLRNAEKCGHNRHIFPPREPERTDYRTTRASVCPFRRRCDKLELTISSPPSIRHCRRLQRRIVGTRRLPRRPTGWAKGGWHLANAAPLSSYRPVNRPNAEKGGHLEPFFGIYILGSLKRPPHRDISRSDVCRSGHHKSLSENRHRFQADIHLSPRGSAVVAVNVRVHVRLWN
jgi:hypothetical protein